MRPAPRPIAHALALLAFAAASASLRAPAAPHFTVDRPPTTYASSADWTPDYVMDKHNLEEMSMHTYVVVEGYLTYVANAAQKPIGPSLPRLEDDGDYHFSISSVRKLRTPSGGKDLKLLVCEITPQLRLDGCEFLKQMQTKLDKYKKATTAQRAHLIDETFLRVRVSGYLRFGTEATHDGAREYPLGTKPIKGHWEVHPVESVALASSGNPVKIGPTATFEKTINTGKERYSITQTSWPNRGPANYAHFKGTIKRIAKKTDGSGDYEVTLTVTETGKLKGKDVEAVVPQYYVNAQSSTGTRIVFRTGLCRDNGKPLEVGQTAVTLYGLRSWQIDTIGRTATPLMCPVERIR